MFERSTVAGTTEAGGVTCAQCGREPLDTGELALWRPHVLVDAGPSDELAAAMLLCPDCVDDDRRGTYDAGEAD